MSHIVDFSISGLAGNEGTYSQELNRDVNIFFGLNGSGKTSLLKILHSAMENNADILDNVPFKSASVSIYSVNYKKTFTYSIEQKNISQVGEKRTDIDQASLFDLDSVFRSEVSARNELYYSSKISWNIKPNLPSGSSGSWAHQYLSTSRLYTGIGTPGIPRSQVRSEEQLDLIFSSYLQRLWSQYSSNILGAVRKAQEDGLANIFKAILSGERQQSEEEQQVDPDVAYKRVAAFLKRQGSPNSLVSFAVFKKRYANDLSFRNVVNDINDVEVRIAQATNRRDKLQGFLQEMFSGNKKVYLQDNSVEIETNQNTKIGLNTLSSGEKHLLMILIDTLLAERSSILIDEPEISMHIDWQKQLIDVIHQLNPSAQLIIATHSPEIMADIPDNRIFRI